MAESGRDYRVYVSDDGTSMGAKTEIEFQGDLTLNPGKPINFSAYKNGTRARHGRDGFQVSFTMAPAEPLGAGQALLDTHIEDETSGYFWVETTSTGGFSWEGPMKAAYTDIPLNTDGEFETTVELRENGSITRSIVA